MIKFTNNFIAPLAAGISTGDTSITLSGGYGSLLPVYGGGDYEYMTLVNPSNQLEIVKVTARSGDVLTVTRGQDGTTARSWSAGDKINSRPCSAAMNDALQINVAKANVDSQVFTGTPSLPTGTIGVTQAPGNNSTKLATTAFSAAANAATLAAAGVAANAYTDAKVAAAPSGIGVGQTWQAVSRSANTAYTNSTGRSIQVSVSATASEYNTITLDVSTNGSTWVTIAVMSGAATSTINTVIPNTHQYRVVVALFGGIINSWTELR